MNATAEWNNTANMWSNATAVELADDFATTTELASWCLNNELEFEHHRNQAKNIYICKNYSIPGTTIYN